MSTDTLPPPPVPADCDLRGMLFMPLDVQRLLDSDLFINATGDEFKAAVALWCKSWSQVPAASLPDDDRALAHYSRAGSKWAKVKAVALSGWTKASDGRLYHAVVAEKAMDAWEERKQHRAAANNERERKRREREDRQQLFDTIRAAGQVPPWNTPTATLRAMVTDLSRGRVTDQSRGQVVTGSDESRLRQGEGQGQGQGQYTPAAAAAVVGAPPSEPGLFDQPGAQAPAMLRSWMDWRLTIGRHRVYLDREGNAEAHWAELFNRAGWDEFTKAWNYCAARTTKPDGKVFLSNLLEVIQ